MSINSRLIKSISDNQDEIIRNIISLYLEDGRFDLDPTYSKGIFYKNIQEPRYKSDLYPLSEDVLLADCRNLSFYRSGKFKSIMFDPPFIISGTDKENTSHMRKRFGDYRTIKDLFEFYNDSLKEFYRLLEPAGILIFKCQDTVSSGKQYLSHVKIINMAEKLGFYSKDLFILQAKNRMLDPRIKQQRHARKFHSYFLVFQKGVKA